MRTGVLSWVVAAALLYNAAPSLGATKTDDEIKQLISQGIDRFLCEHIRPFLVSAIRRTSSP
jgi:hypothetical protein